MGGNDGATWSCAMRFSHCHGQTSFWLPGILNAYRVQHRLLIGIQSMFAAFRPVLLALVIGNSLSQIAQGQPVLMLQPHKIAYEIALDKAQSSSNFVSARGLMAFEFTGNACDGYATNFRQVTELSDSDGNARQLDFKVNSWEDGAANQFRFTLKNLINGQVSRDVDGEARKAADGSLAIAIKRPAHKKLDFDGDAVFPTRHLAQLILAAKGGERRFARKIFDGSEGGEKVFETLSSIGQPMQEAQNGRVEPALRNPAMDQLARWPVSTTYFEEGPGDRVPVYTMRLVVFENGVISDLAFEFPDFTLKARAVRVEMLKSEPCVQR
jgi:EipB-like